MFKRLLKTKTFWAAMTAIITAAEQVATGSAHLVDGLQLVIPAVLAIFVRDGIEKKIPAGNDLRR